MRSMDRIGPRTGRTGSNDVAAISHPTKVALFAPCFVDQLFPHVAIAALELLERLGVAVDVPPSAACCGQPAANAGFEHDGDRALRGLVRALAPYDRIIVLSGSCAVHVRAHASEIGGAGERIAERTTELCAFLHDDVGLDAIRRLGARFPHRVGLHIGCHALRGLGLARPSETQLPPFNKVRALLEAVDGISFASLARPDECCGFGGTFAVTEPAISARMGRDRLDDYSQGSAEVIVSTDMSCMMHLGGIARAAGAGGPPMVHVAEVLAGDATPVASRQALGALGARR
jgi:L-lactate dehydrogenase complex protein LldE